jgi:endonuclease/exonuclease/phosphatase family metal-dependent hydrolase
LSDLRVMSFNVRGARFNDGENAWEQRAGLNVETIQHCAPDLIGFQELQLDNLEIYQQRLPEYEYWLGLRASSKVPPFEYAGIFWNAERLTLLDAGGCWLNETPHIFAVGWDAACARVANWVRLQVVDNGRELLFLNTHLDHVGEEARVNGSQLILQRLSELQANDLPVIVSGDFNCNPASPAYQLFMEHGFTDTYIATGNMDDETSNTFHAFGRLDLKAGKHKGEILRIDWILLRDLEGHIRPEACEIVRNAQPPLYPSDHYPVLTRFVM